MKTTIIASISLSLLALGGCASSPSVANYRPGDDVASIKDARNRRSAITSDAELEQHRRQRQNVAEEMQLEKAKQQRTIDNILTPVKIARELRILR